MRGPAALEGDVNVRVLEITVGKRSHRVSDIDPIFKHPGRDHHQRARDHYKRRTQPSRSPKDKSHRVEHHHESRVLRGIAVSGQQADRDQQASVALLIPDLDPVEHRKHDCRDRNVYICRGSVDSDHRAHIHQKRRRRARRGFAHTEPIGPHGKRQRDQKCEMHQRRSGMPADSERRNKQHLHSRAQRRVDIREHGLEAVRLQVKRDQAQVVARTIRTDLRRPGVEQVEDGERCGDRGEQIADANWQ